MKWLLTLLCVNCLVSAAIYPMMTIGVDLPMNWLLESGITVAGVGSLYLLYRYRKSL